MKKPAPPITPENQPDDAALFRTAVGAVTPLTQQNHVAPQRMRRKATINRTAPRDDTSDNWSDFAAEDSPHEFLRNGIGRLTLRKLRNGTYPIQDSLDLHGSHIDTARKLLQEFLQEAAQRQLRCVRIIHGKGINSTGGTAVLRNLTRHWLSQHAQVLAYCEALPAQGGSGAVLVLLKVS
jgi:DNA-nicking Smr family endonuclease